MKSTFDHVIIGAFIAAVCLMGMLGFLSLRGMGRQVDTAEWVEHSQIVIDRLQSILTEVQEASTGVRGYVLTNNRDYLLDLAELQERLPQQMRSLEVLTEDNKDRRVDMPVVENLVTQYIAKLKTLTASSVALSSSLVDRLNQSNQFLKTIDVRITAIQADERVLLQKRAAEAERSSRIAEAIIMAGSICGIIIISGSTYFLAREMTKRQQTEEQIRSLNEQLGKRAGELESSNKELEAFTYSVSHDLRAPLRHVHGFVELLQKSPALQAEPTSQRQMNLIAKAAKQMGVLIDDLLAFSRTGRAQMHPVSLDMGEMVGEVIQDLDMECSNRRVAWDIGKFEKISGDPALLRLVWMNLISNALKYTRPREVAKIAIGEDPATAKDVKEHERSFYIRDNGVGFDMQYAHKLFGVFQRLHRAEEFEGTGIGLANVQRIVHRHGGRVWAESELDIGSVFHFSLPQEMSEPQAAHA